jgi:hypothetical protein
MSISCFCRNNLEELKTTLLTWKMTLIAGNQQSIIGSNKRSGVWKSTVKINSAGKPTGSWAWPISAPACFPLFTARDHIERKALGRRHLMVPYHQIKNYMMAQYCQLRSYLNKNLPVFYSMNKLYLCNWTLINSLSVRGSAQIAVNSEAQGLSLGQLCKRFSS